MQKRSITIENRFTSMSLEDVFWEELERQAPFHGLSWQDYTRRLALQAPAGMNRSSFIRENLLKNIQFELAHTKRKRIEAWWTIRASQREYEIGTRGALLLAGRNPDNDMVIYDESVSRKHLMLGWDGATWWAVDLSSKNGTLLNGSRIHAACLAAGSILFLGDVELQLN